MPRLLSQLSKIDVEVLKGVGPQKRHRLNEMGISTVLDILMNYPRTYIDRSNQVYISRLKNGESALVVGEIVRINGPRKTRTGKTIVEVDINDKTGTLRCAYFNQPWRATQLQSKSVVAVFGKVDISNGFIRMSSPVLDLVGDRTGKIVPIYRSSEKANIATWEIAKYVEESLERAGEFFEPLESDFLAKNSLIDRTWAFKAIHFPNTVEDIQKARRRLAFDELLRLQIPLIRMKHFYAKSQSGNAHTFNSGGLLDQFLDCLPFKLTKSQSVAIEDIKEDLKKSQPMHRLLQGDVGAGKTVVAVATLIAGIENGFQGAFMAPTEILSEQHFENISELLENFKVHDPNVLGESRQLNVRLLTSRLSTKTRNILVDQIANGEIDIVIGTHALLSQDVSFKSLGVIVIDEQHRFGVEQRAILKEKALEKVPDFLVMTATPIPRTAAMVVFGDLTLTTLDELPSGRTPIKTEWIKTQKQEDRVFKTIRDEVKKGNRAYIVCPLVEESLKIEAKSAESEYERITSGPLKDLNVGLVHGQMPSKDRETVMANFREGKLDVIVATTVIEVGVDVPDATVMVVESADRFGVAQLHQLRGRVGRSSKPSHCYFVTHDKVSEDASQRLLMLEKESNGFELSLFDLKSRGEGTILGSRQKGRSDLKLASLSDDQDLIELAHEFGDGLIDLDPDLDATAVGKVLKDETSAILTSEDEEYLFKS